MLERLEELKRFWKSEEEHSFEGWDFSYINNRTEGEEIPWNYREIVENLISSESVMLDMGTGGGEFLIELNPKAKKVCATEGYLPNVELSRKRLEPMGIEVTQVFEDEHLDFEDETFDLIINRHEAFDVKEVKRILKKGGIFVTQQVGCENNKELSKFLLDKEFVSEGDSLSKVLEQCRENDLEILDIKEAFLKNYFLDIGALVYYAKIISWEFPEFTVDKCFHKLVELQELIDKGEKVIGIEHRYLLMVKKVG